MSSETDISRSRAQNSKSAEFSKEPDMQYSLVNPDGTRFSIFRSLGPPTQQNTRLPVSDTSRVM
ncbi:MAG: hypothetical protein OXC46_12245 [Thaumarchaeota archaeon]|nr:hypothetical protein [Nitrososphaerota archaeon]